MSNHLVSLTYTRKLGSNLRKSVLALLADKASDDGSGIFASKQTIADELDCSKRAVIETIKAFVSEGIMREVGQRRMANGYTVEYGIVVEAVEALPMNAANVERQRRKAAYNQCAPVTGERDAPVNVVHMTGEPGAPKPPKNPPLVKKATPSPQRAKGFRLPDDWKPVRFSDDSVARSIVDARGIDWAKRALEQFRNHWRSANGPNARKLDWQATWANWVIEQDNRDGRRPTNGVGRDRGQSATGFGVTVDAGAGWLAERAGAANC